MVPVAVAEKKNDCKRVWIHAASVGEVKAAVVLINELSRQRANLEFYLSTMTKHGNSVARKKVSPQVTCFLAPLDVPRIVRRTVQNIEPDLYVCIETELWPAMFVELAKAGIPSMILNGRMTARSYRRYARVRGLFAKMLANISGIAVISDEDGHRFRKLGVAPEILQVTGNIKYDYRGTDTGAMRDKYRAILNAGEKKVFVCGSTRSGEEKILLPVFEALNRCAKGLVWIIAPRHLERLAGIEEMLSRCGIEFDRYSSLQINKRKNSVVLIDTMGDLGYLYSAGDFNFVGGSLVEKGGHNIMEAARWGKPVYFGSCIEDFRDAADILEQYGGGFRVADGKELTEVLIEHLQDEKKYKLACLNAEKAVLKQQGAAGRQADMVLNLLPKAA